MKKLNITVLESITGGNFCPILPDPERYLYCNQCSPGYTIDAILNGSILNDPLGIIAPKVCPD